ncbi:MAG: glycosyltransferase family 2 protein [Candidatus Methylomirabilales bacterium]
MMDDEIVGGQKPVLSMVFPVWNEEENLEILHGEVSEALKLLDLPYELLFVDNGSTDGSLALIKQLARRDPNVRYISLSRNFGHQGGLFAGLWYCRGDAAITMDADLQHPPSLIPEMVRLWQQGFEVVYTKKRNHDVSGLRSIQVRLFYKGLSKLSGLTLSFGQSDFRLLDRRVIDVILNIPENRKFLRGTVEWVGFRQTGLEYDVAKRHAGQSKFSYRSLFGFALDGILAFSVVPLRWIFVVGSVTATLSLLYVGLAFVLGVLNLLGVGVNIPPGWATLAVSVMFLGAVQLIAIGILGEYIGRIYDQTKGRPTFIVRETSDSGWNPC